MGGVVCLFRIRRFEKGFSFLQDSGSNDTGFFIGASILTAVSFLSFNKGFDFIYLVLFFSILMWGLILISWWRERITKKYWVQSSARTVRGYEKTIGEKEAEIASLRKENERLAKIIHKDNKLIPALEYSVREFLQSNDKERGVELLKELEDAFQERMGLLKNCGQTGKPFPSTGIASINIMLAYMQQRAAAQDTDLDFRLLEDLKPLTERIPGEDLRTILADLLENALIAVSGSPVKKVLLNLAVRNGSYTIEVYDSGPPFPREVLSNLGIRPVTTHREEGGSGIGLMTVSELCAKCSARFTVEDLSFDSPPCYSKKVYVVI